MTQITSTEMLTFARKWLIEHHGLDCADTTTDYKVHKIALDALEKQILKKPDFEGDGYSGGELVYDTWICPCCSEHYEVDYDEYDYCPKCGQAIDWGDA